jgi:hypothetical protein
MPQGERHDETAQFRDKNRCTAGGLDVRDGELRGVARRAGARVPRRRVSLLLEGDPQQGEDYGVHEAALRRTLPAVQSHVQEAGEERIEDLSVGVGGYKEAQRASFRLSGERGLQFADQDVKIRPLRSSVFSGSVNAKAAAETGGSVGRQLFKR